MVLRFLWLFVIENSWLRQIWQLDIAKTGIEKAEVFVKVCGNAVCVLLTIQSANNLACLGD